MKAVTNAGPLIHLSWLNVQAIADSSAMTQLMVDLDRGESEAIVLMRETRADILLLDERRARELAQREGLPIIGTIGILRTARNRALIPAVTPLLEDLRRRGFRVSTDLVEQIRREEASL